MTDRDAEEISAEPQESSKRRPWSRPTLDVIAASDAEGVVNSNTHTDAITGIS